MKVSAQTIRSIRSSAGRLHRTSSRVMQLKRPVAILALSAIAGGCGVKVHDYDKERATAVAATEELRRLYNDSEYRRIYDLASPAMQQRVTQTDFVSTAETSRSTAGRYLSSRLAGASCFAGEVRLVFHAEFERGKFTESVLWSLPDGKAQLVMYQVSPEHAPVDSKVQKGCPVQ